MSQLEPRHPKDEKDLWARRRSSNVRLGLALGGVVLALFLIALWKYRPL
ncbi:MAG: hypothetical protein WCH44_08285 [Betaproteobacteria bacterium]